MRKPILVALCGIPGSGKTTVQEILNEEWGIIPVDDGHVLRAHCMELFGLSLDDVNTQAGKKRTTDIQGKIWENRKIIGEYGNALETTFGDLVVPNHAIKTCMKTWTEVQSRNSLGFSFGSVRRGQGRAYRETGGLVIEIVRPGTKPTGNVWDEYERQWITHSFLNDGTMGTMQRNFVKFFEEVLEELKGRQ